MAQKCQTPEGAPWRGPHAPRLEHPHPPENMSANTVGAVKAFAHDKRIHGDYPQVIGNHIAQVGARTSSLDNLAVPSWMAWP